MKLLDRAVVVGVPHKAAIKIKLIPKTFPALCAKIHHCMYQSNLAGTDPEPSRIACETHI